MISETIGIFETQRNAKLVADMQQNGVEIITFPLPEYRHVGSSPKILERLKSIADFDWLIVTCPVSASLFLDILERANIDLFDLDLIKVAAFGESVSDALRFRQVHSDIVINPFSFDETIDSLVRFDRDLDVEGSSFLIVGTEGNVSLVSEHPGFVSSKDVVRFEAAPIMNDGITLSKHRILFLNGCCDRFILGAIEEFYALLDIVGTDGREAFLDSTLLSSGENAVKALIDELA